MWLREKRWRGCPRVSSHRGRSREPGSGEYRMIRIGGIGYGYWGPNVVRNFAELAAAQVTVVSDRRPERLAQAQRRYLGIRVTTDPLDMIADPAGDAGAIVTSGDVLFQVAVAAAPG